MKKKLIVCFALIVALLGGCSSKQNSVINFDKREQSVKENVEKGTLVVFDSYYVPRNHDTYKLRVGNGEFRVNGGEWISQKVIDVNSGASLQVRHNASAFAGSETKTNVYLNNKLIKEFISITKN